jgi:glycosyltransferase involved in cell wall biosynthesis
MRTLVLARFRPHRPTGGAALRNWQNIHALMRFGPVDVVSVGEDGPDDEPHGVRDWTAFSLKRLRENRSLMEVCKTRLWLLRAGVHPSIDVYRSREFAAWLARRVRQERYDTAVVEELSLCPYVDLLNHSGCRVVFDAHNVESALRAVIAPGPEASIQSRIRSRILQRRLISEEGRVIHAASAVWACSTHDAEEIGRLYGRRTGVKVVPNGVNVEAYRNAGVRSPGSDWSDSPITLVYPGTFAYRPNVDAAMRLITAVVPALRSRGYRVRAVLVGRSPSEQMRAAASRDADVEVTGAVESVVPYLEQPCIVTLPIEIGSGTRLKILEAFAVGRPVLTTVKGAEGIDAIDNKELVIRATPESFAEAAIALWRPLKAVWGRRPPHARSPASNQLSREQRLRDDRGTSCPAGCSGLCAL